MKIAEVRLAVFERGFVGGAFVAGHARQTSVRTRPVRLALEDGRVGYGEMIHRPDLATEAARADEDIAAAEVEGLDLADLPERLDEMRRAGRRAQAYGIELAYYDLIARSAGLPLSAMLGATSHAPVSSFQSISADAQAETIGPRPLIQLKLTGADGAQRAILGALETLSEAQTLLVDFNGALSLAEARRLAAAITDKRLIWEDPCLSYGDNAALVRETGARLMFDMSLKGPGDYIRVAADRLAAAAAIKPAVMGGVWATRAAIDICAAADIPMRIDGPWCGPIGAAAAIHFARCAPRRLMLGSIDLTEPILGDHGFAVTRRETTVDVAAGPGLGFDPASLFNDGEAR